MSLLFTIESKIVKPYTETLLISPFREIWERDTNAGKFTAIDEFTYIEFMTSVKKSNPYRGYTPEERAKRLAIDVMKHELYEPDELVKKGMESFIAVNQNGMFRVFAFSSDDERQIRIELVKVREKFPDAWILKLAK